MQIKVQFKAVQAEGRWELWRYEDGKPAALLCTSQAPWDDIAGALQEAYALGITGGPLRKMLDLKLAPRPVDMSRPVLMPGYQAEVKGAEGEYVGKVLLIALERMTTSGGIIARVEHPFALRGERLHLKPDDVWTSQPGEES